MSLFSAFLISACGKKQYTIEELFAREDCSGECYVVMPCEGEEITLRTYLTGTNVMRNGNSPMFFMRDPDDPAKTIKVVFDETIPEEEYLKLREVSDQYVQITGIIEGYDLLNPEFCRRAHIINVQTAEDLKFE